MRFFKDKNGKQWDVELTPATIKRVKGLTGVNLYGLLQNNAELFRQIANDPEQRVNVLFAMVSAQASRDGVTDEQFAELLDGPAFEAASDALIESFADFFTGQKDALLAALNKSRRLTKLATDEAVRRINDPADEESLRRKLSDLSTGAPESPASTQAT